MINKKSKKKVQPSVVISAILCLTLLEVVAMLTGTDGKFLLPIVAVIAGLAGLITKTPKILKGGE